MLIKGPIATLAAVTALGAGIFLANVSQTRQPAEPPQPAAATAPAQEATAPSTDAAAPAADTAAPPSAAPFGPREDFVTEIPTKSGPLGLQIRVTGDTARAYACDNYGIETWLSGSTTGGVVTLTSADKSARLTARHQGDTVVGRLWIGEKYWDFTAASGETDAF
ncbi:MAG: hypothetical protein U1D00_18060 [Mycobacterium sp.]|nr:hypothetical protein [Mycobacterium sp.]